ncbi:MAG: DUF4394 domain-containing protein [Bythopirellula sp.]|nr:DUF4394 domain-containing protein [Bythopirellula sp.]
MKKFIFAFLLGVSSWSLSSSVSAETIYGIAELGGQTLVTWDSASPNDLDSGYVISGLLANETIKAIDFRPATGGLYALGSTSRLYTVDVNTGVATEVPPPGAFTPTLNGFNFGFDFNPVIDRLRVVSDVNKNYVLNPNDGSATGVIDLFYNAADPNFGVDPNVVHSAYTNNTNPAPTSTQLYGIDTGLNILVTQANSAGTLGTVGPLGLDVAAAGGFDISGVTGIAYAALLPTSSSQSRFYRINLLTGAATDLGVVDGGLFITALTIAPDGADPFVPEPASVALLGLAAMGMCGRKWRVA